MTNAVIAYSNRSCVTGKALYEFMKEGEVFSRLNKVLKTKRIRNTDVLIRWGNSTSDATVNTPAIEINKREAIVNASNKLKMMKILASTEGIQIPMMIIPSLLDSESVKFLLPTISNEDGKFFARNGANGEVRLADEVQHNDSYLTKPIDKDREYRVHVFGDEVIGIYEKIPTEGEICQDSIMKDHNSQFVRCNTDLDLRCNAGAQEMCVKAVKAMGLDFGGVDIIRERDTKEFFLVEVNSSPSLNNLNIKRYVEKFVEFINIQGEV